MKDNKQFVDGLNWVVDFSEEEPALEFILDKETNVMKTETPKEKKYVKKTVYINNRYKDVVEFFERKDSSVQICELIREAMKRERGEVSEVELSEAMKLIKDIHEAIVK